MNKLTENSISAILKLHLVEGIGPRTFSRLIEHFDSAENVLSATPSELRALPGIGAKLTSALANAKHNDVDPILEQCRSNSIKLVDLHHDQFPQLLRQIYDPPGLLFSQGEIRPEDDVAVAIVGTRHATNYGQKIAEQLARGLAMSGITVVSGLARGIDGIAHRAALDAGGRTIAVLGSGILNLYPPEHQDLATEICRHGAIVSEMLPGHPPKSGAFPQRNRIITGMSLGVIVVEAAQRSGALISARLAMEQDREVFAVPGRIDSRMSQGCNRLLKDGAKLVESVEDVLEELGPLHAPTKTDKGRELRHPAELKLTEQEQLILQTIGTEATEIDYLVEKRNYR